MIRRRTLVTAGLAGAGIGLLGAGLASRAAMAQTAPLLRAVSRVIEVNGRAATVFGLVGAEDRPGHAGAAGSAFRGAVQNDSSAGLILHYHGQIAPEEADRARPGGGVLAEGQADAVDFALTAGTHWMHAHDLSEQLLMAAPMIGRLPGEEAENEIVLMLHDFSFTPPEELLAGLGSVGGHGAMAGMTEGAADAHAGHDMGAEGMGGAGGMAGMVHANDISYDAFLANDRTLDDPEVVTVEPGRDYRLRVINGATASAFWIETGALQAACVAVDGQPCLPVPGRIFPLAMGQRIDLTLHIPPGGGAFPVLARVEGLARRTGIVLASPGAAVERVSEEAASAAPLLGLDFEAALQALDPLPQRAADRVHHVMLGEEAGYRWTLNGGVHGEVPPLTAGPGERVEFMFMNPTSMMHPMHLHGHHFQVVEIDGWRFQGARRDTVIVPPGSMVTVAFDARPGAWYLHCHHLYHMSGGMMAELLVG